MKFYVYAGYYENFISGHKLPKPYILRDEFKTFDEALDYVLENFDDDLFFTKDVINYAINNGIVNDYNLEDYLMKESKESTTKSIKESKGTRLIPSDMDDAIKFFNKNVEINDSFVILEYFEIGENVTIGKAEKDLYHIYDGKNILNKSTRGMINYLDCLGLTIEFID